MSSPTPETPTPDPLTPDRDGFVVLIEPLASKRRGRTLYFEQMTGIGPMTTPELAEAARFASFEEARRSPAYVHALSCFRPGKVGADVCA